MLNISYISIEVTKHDYNQKIKDSSNTNNIDNTSRKIKNLLMAKKLKSLTKSKNLVKELYFAKINFFKINFFIFKVRIVFIYL